MLENRLIEGTYHIWMEDIEKLKGKGSSRCLIYIFDYLYGLVLIFWFVIEVQILLGWRVQHLQNKIGSECNGLLYNTQKSNLFPQQEHVSLCKVMLPNYDMLAAMETWKHVCLCLYLCKLFFVFKILKPIKGYK